MVSRALGPIIIWPWRKEKGKEVEGQEMFKGASKARLRQWSRVLTRPC